MEPAPEGASVTAVPVSAADSTVELAEVEEGVGVAGESDAAARGAEAVGDSEEDGEDVFEVEKILDMKTEGRGGRELETARADPKRELGRNVTSSTQAREIVGKAK
ncbi:M-phase phosphoprotein 8 [Saguinus oedipus]|uniref:M-phase phosphoprotein 8 n=1 Tax=Saguinus oedipus TaxID=9490 RepID=A0ABQ9VTN4_SAGOE|nr:M-phase phosphoprotein 8 [Saguinus oedipus]